MLITGISLLVNFGFIAATLFSGMGHIHEFAEDEYPQLREIWSYGDGAIKVARIPLVGVITREMEQGFLGMSGVDRVESVLRQIRAAQNDEDVKAIILEVDSPGGEITPTDEIYQALKDFKESADGRKVIIFVKDIAASGAYYVSMAGDWIIAQPTATIGSIGVIIQTLNWKELSEKIGIQDVTIKTGANKDLLNPFRAVSTNQVDILQVLINNNFERFLRIVKEGRRLDLDKLRPLADGRVFPSEDALQHRLIDDLGYWDGVVDKTTELLGVTSIKIVRYEEHVGWARLFTQARLPQVNLNIPELRNMRIERPRLLFMWRP